MFGSERDLLHIYIGYIVLIVWMAQRVDASGTERIAQTAYGTDAKRCALPFWSAMPPFRKAICTPRDGHRDEFTDHEWHTWLET